jgi:hypothetical protein
MFRLRRLGLLIATQDDHYTLDTTTDVGEVERLAGESRRASLSHDPQRAIGALSEALALWRGRPLADLDDLPEATIVAGCLEELVEGLREELLTLELDHRRPAELIAQARQLAAEQPYRERRWELLMLALYRAGRQAEALDAYAECRRRLLDDLGLDPGVGLRRMQQAVLAQDPVLDPPVQSTRATAATGLVRVAPEAGPGLEPTRIPGTSTRLIGRAMEQRDLAEVWDRARLVTLLGPPGAGKTRLLSPRGGGPRARSSACRPALCPAGDRCRRTVEDADDGRPRTEPDPVSAAVATDWQHARGPGQPGPRGIDRYSCQYPVVSRPLDKVVRSPPQWRVKT